MTGVLTERGNVDTLPQGEYYVKIVVMMPQAKELHKPRNYPKRGESPGTDSCLALSDGSWFC